MSLAFGAYPEVKTLFLFSFVSFPFLFLYTKIILKNLEDFKKALSSKLLNTFGPLGYLSKI
jgi:hypothetical protein